MTQPPTHLHHQLITEPLPAQRIGGKVRARFYARSLNPTEPATRALSIRVFSNDCKHVRGALLPITTGTARDRFGEELELHVACPPLTSTVDAEDGDRVVVELGSVGDADIELREEKDNWILLPVTYAEADVAPVGNDKRRHVGACIYCDTRTGKLSDEHIIPYGLNGELELLEASCQTCADVTSGFERDVQRTWFGAARTGLGMRSRRRRRRPEGVPIRVRKLGIEQEILLPKDIGAAFVAAPVFAPPSPAEPGAGLRIVDIHRWQITGRPLLQLHHELGYEYTGVRLELPIDEFARMIAKIAYGFAVLCLGLERIAECWVLPAILGDTREIARWVGCETSAPLNPTTGIHAVRFRLDADNVIHVFVRLFAQFETPEYHVIVGRARSQG